jgi:hypothetical protein
MSTRWFSVGDAANRGLLSLAQTLNSVQSMVAKLLLTAPLTRNVITGSVSAV